MRDDKNSKDSKSTKSERHLKSSIPKDRQAYLLKIGEKTIFVTYFGFHDPHINPFHKKGILVGDFKKSFRNFTRLKYTTSTSECPILLIFRYHLSERAHIINKQECEFDIDFNEFSCDPSKNECACLSKIESIILENPENRECNLRIFGGSQAFFELDYKLVEDLINLEFLEKKGYEPIFNFLLGCLLADKINAGFNTNIKLEFGKVAEETDIILLKEGLVVIIENTREHDVCGEKDETLDKMKKITLKCAQMYSTIKTNSRNKLRLKFALVTFTPESNFTNCGHFEGFIKTVAGFIHIGIPDDFGDEILRPKYFSLKNAQEIFNHQLEKLLDFLTND